MVPRRQSVLSDSMLLNRLGACVNVLFVSFVFFVVFDFT